jgi:hypothetical protein
MSYLAGQLRVNSSYSGFSFKPRWWERPVAESFGSERGGEMRNGQKCSWEL